MEPASRSLAHGEPGRILPGQGGLQLAPAPEPHLAPRPLDSRRIGVAGKFLTIGEEPFFLRGVTYGPFAPDTEGCEYKTDAVVASDFARMAAGETLGPHEMHFVTAPLFQTGDHRYAWLNRTQAIGKAVALKGGDGGYVRYQLFAVT